MNISSQGKTNLSYLLHSHYKLMDETFCMKKEDDEIRLFQWFIRVHLQVYFFELLGSLGLGFEVILSHNVPTCVCIKLVM